MITLTPSTAFTMNAFAFKATPLDGGFPRLTTVRITFVPPGLHPQAPFGGRLLPHPDERMEQVGGGQAVTWSYTVSSIAFQSKRQ